MELLHILNGDSTRVSFGGTGLPGSVAVWREALCEGPVSPDGDAIRVLQERAHLFPEYDRLVIDEWARICRHLGPVVLWFEFDLFCQINLLFLVSHLPETNPLFLICPGDHPEIPGFRGLGECNARQLAELYLTRVSLSEADRQVARHYWQAYTASSPAGLTRLWNPGPFVHLPAAIDLHLRRFPSTTNGLNIVETFFLEKIRQKPAGVRTLLPQFWQTFPAFGFGDTQLSAILHDLVRYGLLTDGDDVFSCTPAGHSVLTETADYVAHWTGPRWLGGCELVPGTVLPRWNPAGNHLELPPF